MDGTELPDRPVGYAHVRFFSLPGAAMMAI
jgi:hypothetical protein